MGRTRLEPCGWRGVEHASARCPDVGELCDLRLSISRGDGGVDPLDRVMLAVAALGAAGWFAFTDPTLATLAVILADVMASDRRGGI